MDWIEIMNDVTRKVNIFAESLFLQLLIFEKLFFKRNKTMSITCVSIHF